MNKKKWLCGKILSSVRIYEPNFFFCIGIIKFIYLNAMQLSFSRSNLFSEYFDFQIFALFGKSNQNLFNRKVEIYFDVILVSTGVYCACTKLINKSRLKLAVIYGRNCSDISSANLLDLRLSLQL